VEHVSLAMSTVVRDLLTTGRTYIDLPLDTGPRADTWSDPAVSGGGYGQGQLTHGIGLLFRLLADRATEVCALTGPAGGSVELHDAIALRFADGAIGTISGAALPWGTFGNTHQLQARITGERGQVLLDLDRPLVRRSRGEHDDVTVELSADDITWSFGRVVDRFVDLAAGRTTEIRSPAELGARVVEVLDATYRSAASGRWEPTAPG
jgi:predicted dehydrogenase